MDAVDPTDELELDPDEKPTTPTATPSTSATLRATSVSSVRKGPTRTP